jgi:hypothetical protein
MAEGEMWGHLLGYNLKTTNGFTDEH